MYNCFTGQTASIQKTRKDVQGKQVLLCLKWGASNLGERQEQVVMSGLGAQAMGPDNWTFIPSKTSQILSWLLTFSSVQ